MKGLRHTLPVVRHHDGQDTRGRLGVAGILSTIAEVGVRFVEIVCGCSRFRKDIFDDLLRDIGTVRVSGL